MVKFRGKPKKKQIPHVAGETGVVQMYSAPATNRWGRGFTGPFRAFFRLSRNARIITGLLILVAALAVATLIYRQNQGPKYGLESTAKGYTFVGEKAGEQIAVDELKGNAPSRSADDDVQASYYRELSQGQAILGDYKGAIQTLEKWDEAGGAGMTYFDFIELAGYNHKAGDDTSAQQNLSRALNMLPEQDNELSGYIRSDYVATIERLKKEYAE